MADQPAPVSPTSTDGWGELENGINDDNGSEKEGWDDIEPLEDPRSSQALATIQAAQKRPVSQPKQGISFEHCNFFKIHVRSSFYWIFFFFLCVDSFSCLKR